MERDEEMVERKFRQIFSTSLSQGEGGVEREGGERGGWGGESGGSVCAEGEDFSSTFSCCCLSGLK